MIERAEAVPAVPVVSDGGRADAARCDLGTALARVFEPSIGRSRPTPDLVAFQERSAIIEYDGGVSRREAERRAAAEQSFSEPMELFVAAVSTWRAGCECISPLMPGQPGEARLSAALRFIDRGWGVRALACGWSEIEIIGVCPDEPWRQLDRLGAAFALPAVKEITVEAVQYENGVVRRRGTINRDGGAVLLWGNYTGASMSRPSRSRDRRRGT